MSCGKTVKVLLTYIDGNNVTRTVPAFFGSGEDEYQIARRRFTDEMSDTVSELKSSASGVVTTDSSREADGLISHYPFEDLRSASVIDVVGGHDGQIADVGFEAEGRVGHGFRFDGGDDGIRVPHVARESFTISFWVRTSAQCRGNDNDPRWFLGDGLVDHLVVEEPGPRAPALLYAVDSDDHLACAMLLARCTEATTNRPFSMPGLGGGIRVSS